LDRIFVWFQYLIPQHGLSRLVHRATRVRAPWFRKALIRGFVRLFRVDMTDAATADPDAYEHFNAFFTRALRDGARPLPASSADIACPVDGTISQAGAVDGTELIQAKDRRYSVSDLLGDPQSTAFEGGTFVTIYLAPYNYHRIHMPLDGSLREMRFLPGRLFSVNAATVRSVPRLFARNERVSCLFETARGPLAVVLVGALNVGSIETVWAGEVAPRRPREPARFDYAQGAVELARGAELGRFNMGSTVILLFPPGAVRIAGHLTPGRTVRMGETLGSLALPQAASEDR
jgi:phosphatidylserine decarboxylase